MGSEMCIRDRYTYIRACPHLPRGAGGLAARLPAEVDRLASRPVPDHDIPSALDEVSGHAVTHDAQPYRVKETEGK